MIVSSIFRWYRFVFAKAEVTATAATAATITSGDNTTNHKQCLARRRRNNKVRIDVLFAKLFRNVQSERSIVVVDVSLRQVTQDGMSTVYFFELFCRIWIVGILVRVVLKGEFSVCLLDLVRRCRLL